MRRIALAFASLVLAIPMAGSVPAPTDAPRPLLWKVSDADSTVYLLGSFHLLKKTDYPLPADVEQAFGDAERLVFEVAPEELADPSVPMRMMQRAVQPGDAAFGKVAPAPVADQVRAELTKLGLPAAQFDQFEPWMVSITMVTVLAQKLGYAGEDGLDRHLMQRAKDAGKPTAGLETLDSQLDAMDATPVAEQLASLAESVADGEDMGARLDELHAAWRAADVASLEKLAVDEMRTKTPDTYRRLNVERNRAWMPKVQALLDGRDDALVVVGAVHLLGRDGLVAQLKSRGLRVERVCTACAPGKAR
jgi:uncharacterized protein YbaP (TraB family)